MLSSIDFASLLQYSPRGNSQVERTSRKVTDTVKAGRLDGYKQRIAQIISDNIEQLTPFLNEGVTLVPAPRSSLIRDSDLWPPLEICKLLASLNLGEIATCLIRREAIRKSSLFYKADDRPSIEEQFNSLAVENYAPSANITLVDDVITLGRTTIAGASRLAEKFPNATIRVLSLIRTNGFSSVENILDVRVGTITYNPNTGRCSREP